MISNNYYNDFLNLDNKKSPTFMLSIVISLHFDQKSVLTDFRFKILTSQSIHLCYIQKHKHEMTKASTHDKKMKNLM